MKAQGLSDQEILGVVQPLAEHTENAWNEKNYQEFIRYLIDEHPDQVGDGAGAQFGGTVKDIDAHVIVTQQGKACHRGEHRPVQPDIEILHPDVAGGKEVSLYHYGKADDDNGQREPGKDFSDNQINSADEGCYSSEKTHIPPFSMVSIVLNACQSKCRRGMSSGVSAFRCAKYCASAAFDRPF